MYIITHLFYIFRVPLHLGSTGFEIPTINEEEYEEFSNLLIPTRGLNMKPLENEAISGYSDEDTIREENKNFVNMAAENQVSLRRTS